MWGCEDVINLSDDENVSEVRTVPNVPKDDQLANQTPKTCPAICGFNKIYEENRLFAELLLKCLDLQNSDGMVRVINKAMLKNYYATDEHYRNSSAFNKVLTKAFNRLTEDPSHKFSHVKDVVETLKLHRSKKRVQLTTLETNLKKNSRHKRKRTIEDVIDLVDEQTDVPTINLEDDQNDGVRGHLLSENGINSYRRDDAEKENVLMVIDLDDEPKNTNTSSDVQNNNIIHLVEAEPNSQTETLLQPRVDLNELEYNPNTSEIEKLEGKIALLKGLIDKYDQAEVTDDASMSPYLKVEGFKKEIVAAYKRLCELIGVQPIKKRQVRLQVLEGHPPGPTRILEKFINDNIGDDGIPPFPDMCDVVQCVMVANIEENLGWNKHLVMKEASALFTQCGRALQKKRQRREYRDLLALVRRAPGTDPAGSDPAGTDPADSDPALLARLEHNQRVARGKEDKLLEKFTMLQNLPPQKPVPSLEVNHNESINVDYNTNETSQQISNESDEDSNFELPQVMLSSQNAIGMETNETDSNLQNGEQSDLVNVKVKSEPIDIVEMLEKLGDNFTTTVIDIEDPFLVIEISSDSSDDEDGVIGDAGHSV